MSDTARVALTFESDGDPRLLPTLLETLAGWNARATFFIDGRWAETNPDVVRAIARGGHELGNHGYRHTHWTALSDSELEADVDATERVVESLVGRSTRPWARPPYGAFDDRVVERLGGYGYAVVYRDAVDGAHWPGETNADSVRRRALQAVDDEGVVVFHTSRADTASALPHVLAGLRDRGRAPVGLSELARKLSPRADRHPDFADLAIAPGSVHPSRPGRWSSINLLELGAMTARATREREEVARVAGTVLELVTGPAATEPRWYSNAEDRYVLVIAGAVRCDLRDRDGDLGHLVGAPGDLFLCPAGAEHRLTTPPGSAARFIVAILGAEVA
jgi:peptidoglycan/xylan/chitin deacetylase (PgdA/CDA1 family)/quercetin dioxygenase-like cupin family protein